MVGIAQGAEIVVRAMTKDGVLSDSGANSCVTDSKQHLIQCHDVHPVSVGLTSKSGNTPLTHESIHIGGLTNCARRRDNISIAVPSVHYVLHSLA